MSNNTAKLHEPLFHIVKRSAIPKWQSWLVRIGSVIAALIVCGVVTVLLTGEDPIQVYVKMVEGAVGSERRLWMLAQNTAMLLCVALAVTPAFKMKFWNIGAEGQVLAGGLATAACMIFLGDKLSPVVLMIVMVAVSIVAGAVWGLIPAFFKALWNTNETLFTLMMNYIAMCYHLFAHKLSLLPVNQAKINHNFSKLCFYNCILYLIYFFLFFLEILY